MLIIVYIPKDTAYLAEFINDFLKVYNTVSVQVTKDCYVIRLEQPLMESKNQMGNRKRK